MQSARVHSLQRSELAVPATSPHFFEKAARGSADTVFLDLEDAVIPAEKAQGRAAAVKALNEIDWGRKRMVVRVNGLDTPWGYRDILEVAEGCPRLDAILLPKAGGPRDIQFVETMLQGVEWATGRESPIRIEALIETALGMANVEAIASSSARLEALVFGVGDFIASMRTPDLVMGGFNPAYAVLTNPDGAGKRQRYFADQWHFAMARVATACRAYGLRPIDGPYTDFKDIEGYRASAMRARSLGFEGKWAIHPTQLAIANEIFGPSPDDIAWAHRINEAMRAGAAAGRGAVKIDGGMVDIAHLKLAQNILRQVEALRAGGANGAAAPASEGRR
ncbi:MAG TPA: CoA ester lyase [Hypericibacter adhaerens]|jgi:malyl-CoA/(S)-citramalyl-CoA lyase|uniref:CoA ester lyase n=1 Tax=Hypericibacter adhaerens TaxID=2602016 RepID=A0A5J6N5G7_9PROT|nr:CoA ester lyase [Hypericibacter adhaerens]QEX24654.1 CoA ester lyase [Hypericibacter adhaerens]HWA45864.1 CoA ester lyase [Hypericibacter adhaerens]